MLSAPNIPHLIDELEELGKRFDLDKLWNGAYALIKRIERALEDDRLSFGEIVAIGLELFRLVKAARKAAQA